MNSTLTPTPTHRLAPPSQDDNSLFRFAHALIGAGTDNQRTLTPDDLRNLAEQMRAVEGFVGKRMGTVHEYPMAFYGSSMTDWLMETQGLGKEDALLLGDLMMHQVPTQ